MRITRFIPPVSGRLIAGRLNSPENIPNDWVTQAQHDELTYFELMHIHLEMEAGVLMLGVGRNEEDNFFADSAEEGH